MISLRREAQLMRWLIPETIRKLVSVSFLASTLRLMTLPQTRADLYKSSIYRIQCIVKRVMRYV
jgi:hypothetical protein